MVVLVYLLVKLEERRKTQSDNFTWLESASEESHLTHTHSLSLSLHRKLMPRFLLELSTIHRQAPPTHRR